MMLKDLKLSQQAAQASGAITPLGAEAMTVYQLLSAAGGGAKDFSVVLPYLTGKLRDFL
jgi:3-hydroxyisobutyrate dehydrogenase